MSEAEVLDMARRVRDGAAAVIQGSYAEGAYRGRLSTSALATATASIALTLFARASGDAISADLGQRGRAWLAANANDDGGYGDTVDSPSNVSTTLLAWSALSLARTEPGVEKARQGSADFCDPGGELDPDTIANRLRGIYGDDQTFSVPILMTYALCAGDDAPRVWPQVPRLPFEFAACPHQWFQWIGLPMVSYALPALIAIGQCVHHHRSTGNPITRIARAVTRARTLRILEQIQPEGGGYLEAAPLTSFVTMAMVSMGLHAHPVVKKAIGFLTDSIRDDGSWPIDTNLDTWTTTLAVGALTEAGAGVERDAIRSWITGQQYREEHPYTHSAPGGWAWTDLSGGVPDADDTAGALLALARLDPQPQEDLIEAAWAGVNWLLDLRNRDGGMPTFCRGWGRLPFDQSSPDLTAHGLRAWGAWRDHLTSNRRARVDEARDHAVDYLLDDQDDDGFWHPLWFGSQPDRKNRVYGTAKVLRAVASVRCTGAREARWQGAGVRAVEALLLAQGPEGGWDTTASSVEETALALEGLSAWVLAGGQGIGVREGIEHGVLWLDTATDGGTTFAAAPIGLYFARLWYSERLYPALFAAAGASLAARVLQTASTMG